METKELLEKENYVATIIKPMLLSIKMGWEDCWFDKDNEIVHCINANRDKTLAINVNMDSIQALTFDIFKQVYKNYL